MLKLVSSISACLHVDLQTWFRFTWSPCQVWGRNWGDCQSARLGSLLPPLSLPPPPLMVEFCKNSNLFSSDKWWLENVLCDIGRILLHLYFWFVLCSSLRWWSHHLCWERSFLRSKGRMHISSTTAETMAACCQQMGRYSSPRTASFSWALPATRRLLAWSWRGACPLDRFIGWRN